MGAHGVVFEVPKRVHWVNKGNGLLIWTATQRFPLPVSHREICFVHHFEIVHSKCSDIVCQVLCTLVLHCALAIFGKRCTQMFKRGFNHKGNSPNKDHPADALDPIHESSHWQILDFHW